MTETPRDQNNLKHIRQAMRDLRSLKRSTRQRAERELREFGQEAIVPLGKEIERLVVRLLIFSLTILLTLAPLAVLCLLPGMSIWLPFIFLVLLLPQGRAVIWNVEVLQAMQSILVCQDDVRVINALCGQLYTAYLSAPQHGLRKLHWILQNRSRWPKQDVETLRSRILFLLQRLPETDAETLDQVRATGPNTLLRHLYQNRATSASETELMIAILRAYPLIGDAKSLDCVRRLGQPDNHPDGRVAAQACLPLLQARIHAEAERREKAKIGADLLRSSARDGTTPATLLRAAAANTAETEPEQLLRPETRG